MAVSALNKAESPIHRGLHIFAALTRFNGTARTYKENSTTRSRKKSNGFGLGRCIVCMDQNVTHVFAPCGHACVCQDCAVAVEFGPQLGRRCPIARCRISSVLKFYGTNNTCLH
mmetsp:Transcript_5761/g.6021  ORF Transcript_5761/g.6021 Transcript_5761/m.6021 type:complete len:114 (-) Transcript_5761:144-485(-)